MARAPGDDDTGPRKPSLCPGRLHTLDLVRPLMSFGVEHEEGPRRAPQRPLKGPQRGMSLLPYGGDEP
jgi:hypothetical protein